MLVVAGQPLELRRRQRPVEGDAAVAHLAAELIQIIEGQHVLVKLQSRGAEGAVLNLRMLEQRQQCVVVLVVQLQPLIAEVRRHRGMILP